MILKRTPFQPFSAGWHVASPKLLARGKGLVSGSSAIAEFFILFSTQIQHAGIKSMITDTMVLVISKVLLF